MRCNGSREVVATTCSADAYLHFSLCEEAYLTPLEVIRKIQDAFEKAVNTLEMEACFKTADVEKSILKGEAFSAHFKNEYEKLGKLIKELGLKQDG